MFSTNQDSDDSGQNNIMVDRLAVSSSRETMRRTTQGRSKKKQEEI